ncbi:MAG: glycosyl transferase [Akkermansiaceae bacterium]|nr:glycosyl transferase [Akkermansiaceae bacterium]
MSSSPETTVDPSPGKTVRLTWLMDLGVIGLIALVWVCGFFNLRPLMNPDEGRYAEIPREMALSGDFITPRLNGMKYFEKPPLLYWLSALTFKVTGVNEFSARLWNGLFAVLGILLVYWAGRSLYGRAAGVWASIVLGTCILYYSFSQIVLLDMAVAVTISGALFSFILAAPLAKGRKRFWLMMACYVFMALATLTKGLIGFVLPGAVIFLWALLLKQWRQLLPLYLIPGGLLFLAIAAPWHVMAARANGDFLWFYFVHEHFLRFTTRIHGRYEPWWFLMPFLIGGLFPWIFFAWSGVKGALSGGWKARQENSAAWFLVIWVVFITAFFSKSQSKLIPYILPVFPAAAILLGRHLAKLWSERSLGQFRRAAIGFAGVAVILTLGFLFLPGIKGHAEFEVPLPLLKAAIVSGLAAGIIVTIIGIFTKAARMTLSGIAGTGIALVIGLNMIGSVFDSGSTKSLALKIKPHLRQDDSVYCLRLYAQDLPVYLNRLVTVVGYQGEMQFGIESEPKVAEGRFISQEAFAGEWNKPGTRYAILRKSEFEMWFPAGTPCQELDGSGKLLLVVNRHQLAMR